MAKRKERKRASPSSRPAGRLARFRFWALVAFVFTMPLFFSPWNTEYGYTKAIYTLVFVSFLLVLWAVEALPRREAKVELSWLFPVFPALLLASLLSLSGRTPAPVVLQSATLILYFGFIFLLVVNAPHGEWEVAWILGALLLAGVGNALLALLQHIGFVLGAEGDRMIATMGNRQFLAGFLSYLVFPAVVLLVWLRRPWTWVPALGGTGFVLAVLLLTRQVGVRLALGFGLGFIAFGLGYWRAWVGPWWRWVAAGAVGTAVLGAILGLAGVVGIAALLAAGAALAGLGHLLRRFRLLWLPVAALAVGVVVVLLPPTTPLAAVRHLWERQSGAVRAWDLWVGYEMWRDRPLFGIGLGGYKIHFVPSKPAFLASPRGENYAFPFPRADQAHNEYVQAAAELGAVGATVVLGGMGLLAYLGLRRVGSQPDPRKRLELLLLGGGLVAVFVHAVPTFPFHLPASSLAFVVILGLALSPRYGPVGDLRVSLRRRTLKLVAGGLSLFAIVVSVIAVRDVIADAYLLAGQVSLGHGEVALAREKLARAVALDFYPRMSLYWLGVAHAEGGDFPAAQAALRACFDRYVAETLYLQLASVELKLGEVKAARVLLAELLATRPPAAMERDARYLLAVADLHEGDFLGAQRRLEEVLGLDRDYEWAHFQLGEIARARYAWEEARTHYERALAVAAAKERRLQAAYGTPVSLARLGELRGEEARLRELRTRVEWILGQIP